MDYDKKVWYAKQIVDLVYAFTDRSLDYEVDSEYIQDSDELGEFDVYCEYNELRGLLKAFAQEHPEYDVNPVLNSFKQFVEGYPDTDTDSNAIMSWIVNTLKVAPEDADEEWGSLYEEGEDETS